jgi:hypothetical protein
VKYSKNELGNGEWNFGKNYKRTIEDYNWKLKD